MGLDACPSAGAGRSQEQKSPPQKPTLQHRMWARVLGSPALDGNTFLTTKAPPLQRNRLWVLWGEPASFGICLFKATELLKFKFRSQNNRFVYNQSDVATMIWRTRDLGMEQPWPPFSRQSCLHMTCISPECFPQRGTHYHKATQSIVDLF